MEKKEDINALLAQLQQKYGLTRNPFARSLDVFYEGAQRQHNLETIRHLAIFGDMVLLLTGEKGSGKTQLIEWFARRHAEDVDLHIINAKSSSDQSGVIDRLAALVSVPSNSDSSEQLLSHVIRRYESLFRKNAKRNFVVIDDADLLSQSELGSLVSGFKALPAESGAVLMLSGSPELLDRVQSGEESTSEEWLHQIHLKPLNREDVLEYLELRLNAAGARDDFGFTESQLEQLVMMGKGLPGRINRVCVGVMLGEDLFQPTTSTPAKRDGVTRLVLPGIVAILLVSFLFVSYQHGLLDFEGGQADSAQLEQPDDSSSEIQQESDAAKLMARLAQIDEAIEKTNLSGAASDTETLDDTPVVEVSENNLGEEIKSGGAEELPESVSAPVLEGLNLSQAAESDRAVSVDEANPEGEGLADSQGDEYTAEPTVDDVFYNSAVENTKPVKSPASMQVTKSVAEASPKKERFFRDKSWVESQSPSDHSLQVLGTYNIETARGFINRAPASDQSSLFYLKTVYKGQTWYVVMYGQYASKEEARRTSIQSSEYIRAQKPWIRSFAGILNTYP